MIAPLPGPLALLEAERGPLGPAFASALALAHACLGFATPHDPAPHVLTTLWTLAEMLGRSERTVQRHLLEAGHPWSAVVARFFAFSPNYDTMPTPGGGTRRVVSGTVVRFFPLGRLGPGARVKPWGSRDLAEESRAGRTRPSRSRDDHARRPVSSYGIAHHKAHDPNWVFHILSPLPDQDRGSPASPYDDTPDGGLLDDAFADLEAALATAPSLGLTAAAARAGWVERTARAVALRLADTRFESLWRRLLWVALRAEVHGGTREGFWCLKRLYVLALDARREGALGRPVAWALRVVRDEGLLELERDFGTGPIGPHSHWGPISGKSASEAQYTSQRLAVTKKTMGA